MCVWGGSKAKALQACLISITAARWNGASKSRYIILLKVKRVCCLDQNTVTMALRRVFYHAGFYTRILINSNIALARALSILNTLSKYAYFHAK